MKNKLVSVHTTIHRLPLYQWLGLFISFKVVWWFQGLLDLEELGWLSVFIQFLLGIVLFIGVTGLASSERTRR